MTDPDNAILSRGVVRQLTAMKEYLDELRPGAGSSLEVLDRWHDVELTYTSNAIEGSLLTRAETAAVLEHGLATGAEPLRDALAAVGHEQALSLVRALARDAAPFRELDVRQIHALVLSGDDREGAGRYSSRQRRIAGSAAALPGPAELPALMGDLARWLGAVPATPEAAFEAHWRLVAIHPFDDGNGRVGRLLMNLVLLRAGYPPALIGPEERTAYLDALERRSQGEVEPYATFMASRLFTSLLHAVHVAAEEVRIRRLPLPGTVRADAEDSRADDPPEEQQARVEERSPSRTLMQTNKAAHPSVSGPTRRPAIIVADAGPLIQLAQAGALHLLHRISCVVVVADLVGDAATRGAGLPGAEALRAWIKAGAQSGSAAPVRVEATETGRAVALARCVDPGFSLRGGGRSAVVGWLVERLQDADAATIVLHEGDHIPRVVAGQGRGADLDVLTTRAFLALACESRRGREER